MMNSPRRWSCLLHLVLTLRVSRLLTVT